MRNAAACVGFLRFIFAIVIATTAKRIDNYFSFKLKSKHSFSVVIGVDSFSSIHFFQQ